jgi:enterobactin synthetase component D / holo-[acyl-carrier protein] synthase
MSGRAAENPARTSVQLAGLFPPGAIAAELLGNASVTLLSAAELQLISHCAQKRIEDFTAGRACAHRALAGLGVEDFAVLSAPDRSPIWPAAVVGSITHTAGFRAAVVARARDLRGVGLDCEVIEALEPQLWPRICTAAELNHIERLPQAERQRRAALVFAAKEAFYKCQYPLSGQWVDFEDVVVEPVAWPADAASFTLRALKPLRFHAVTSGELVARFMFRDRWVIAGVSLPASPLQESRTK